MGDNNCAFHDSQAEIHAEFLKTYIDKQLRSFRLRAETVKRRIDEIRSLFLLKIDELVDRSKLDVDLLLSTEETRIQNTVVERLLDIDRMRKMHSDIRENEHDLHVNNVRKLLEELLNIGVTVNASQIDFKENDELVDFLYSSDSIGKVRLLHQKDRRNVCLSCDMLSSLHLIKRDLCLSRTSLYQSSSSNSTSKNGSIDNICGDKDFSEDYFSDESNESSGFCIINTYASHVPESLNEMCPDIAISVGRISSDLLLTCSLSKCKYSNVDNRVILSTDISENISTEMLIAQSIIRYKECEPSYDMKSIKANRDIDQCSWVSTPPLPTVKDEESNLDIDLLGSKVRQGKQVDARCDTNSVDQECQFSLRYESEFQSNKHSGVCVISDITMLPDKRFVFTDHYHNNIQLFDSSIGKIVEAKCPYPIGICTINDTTVAVTLRRSSQIAFFHVEPFGLTRLSEIKVTCLAYIWNVVYKAGRLYVVCDRNDVHILTLGGTEVDMVSSGISVTGGFIRYFDVSDDGKYLYLCEGLGVRLCCLDVHGNHIWSFETSNLPNSFNGPDDHVIEDVCYTNGRLLATNWMQSKYSKYL